MTNEELLSVAEIAERLATRFHEQAADHERKLVEHRAAFGARTEADAKLIAGLREELNQVRNSLGIQAAKEANKVLGMVDGEGLRGAAERVVKERDGLLTQVQDMRAEMERLSAQLGWERAEIKRLQWENATMHKDAEDGYAEAIKVLGDPIALSKERDALRAEVAALQERLRASIARGDFAQMEVAALMSQTPKHPVKVGEWVRRLVPSPACGVGTVAKVVHVDDDTSEIEYDVKRIDGQHGVWFAKNCEPCDPPEATHAEPDLTQLHAKGKEAWSDVPNATQWVEEMRGNTEATHDTEAGKAAAEAAVKTEPDEIKVGDVVEVFQSSSTWTDDVGKSGTITRIETVFRTEIVHLREHPGDVFALCDVRKVTT